MAIDSSLYVPGRTRRNWSAGPRWLSSRGIDSLAYDKRLYTPGSPEMRSLFQTTPPPPPGGYPRGYTGQAAPIRPGMYSTPYGTASVSSPSAAPRAMAVTPAPTAPPMPPEFSADDSGINGKRLDQFVPGASGALEAGLPAPGGAAGPTGAPTSPLLETPPAVDSPLLNDPNAAGGAAGSALVGVGAAGSTPNTVDPMNPQRGYSLQGGMTPGNQRRYFDTTGRIDARATPSAQNYTPAPVRFNNEVPGHSNWSSY